MGGGGSPSGTMCRISTYEPLDLKIKLQHSPMKPSKKKTEDQQLVFVLLP